MASGGLNHSTSENRPWVSSSPTWTIAKLPSSQYFRVAVVRRNSALVDIADLLPSKLP
jgi:hypothetical protein